MTAGLDWLTLIGGGLVIGLLVAAPIGPVNLICIRRSFAFGPLNGFVSGLGVRWAMASLPPSWASA